MSPRLSGPRTTMFPLATQLRMPHNATHAPPTLRLPRTDNFVAPHHTTIHASDHITATNIATTPLLPTKQLPATTSTSPPALSFKVRENANRPAPLHRPRTPHHHTTQHTRITYRTHLPNHLSYPHHTRHRSLTLTHPPRFTTHHTRITHCMHLPDHLSYPHHTRQRSLTLTYPPSLTTHHTRCRSLTLTHPPLRTTHHSTIPYPHSCLTNPPPPSPSSLTHSHRRLALPPLITPPLIRLPLHLHRLPHPTVPPTPLHLPRLPLPSFLRHPSLSRLNLSPTHLPFPTL
ncbi:hypothetical protein Pcinc_016970 [Petrolisthes cinctipes]|uniref:Uncharacterized protein n=1 Tax=Petrolisthes cinctipes TaxID=88211 RepID=A0AAE1FRN9_PETCI|nr:hypothetical protein Pcinc_016970 [Petrolisthes cinctipes]